MDDMISRQAAIDTLKNRWKKTRHYEGIGDDIAEECELYLKQVPSAQPSVSKEEMVGDTISRQAAIKAICEDGTMLERQGKYTMTMAERKQKDADILDSLPSSQPGWIPITERLPEEETIYLITFGSGHVRLSSWHKDTKYNHGFDNIETGFLEDGTMVHFGVTAWMPLPKPYREGDANG